MKRSRSIVINPPDPAIPANIWITFSARGKAWTLTTPTLTFSTMTASKAILTSLWASKIRKKI